MDAQRDCALLCTPPENPAHVKKRLARSLLQAGAAFAFWFLSFFARLATIARCFLPFCFRRLVCSVLD